MEEYLTMVSVPAICAVVYWIINLIKYTVNGDERFKRFIPITAAVLGIVCAVICYFAIPAIVPTDNLLVAIIMGAASGLSATGFNQIIKQLGK